MDNRLTHPDIDRFFGGDAIDLELEYTPVNGTVNLLPGAGAHARRIQVGYLAHDEDPGEYEWAMDNGTGLLETFRTAWDRDQRKAELESEGKLVLVVDEYRHSGVHYSIANTACYPDRRWDVAPRCLFVPCDEIQAQYRACRADMARVISDANAILDEYSRWCNGEVYGVIVETFQKDPETGFIEAIETDSCWGYIGYNETLDALKEQIGLTKAPTMRRPARDEDNAPSP